MKQSKECKLINGGKKLVPFFLEKLNKATFCLYLDYVNNHNLTKWHNSLEFNEDRHRNYKPIDIKTTSDHFYKLKFICIILTEQNASNAMNINDFKFWKMADWQKIVIKNTLSCYAKGTISDIRIPDSAP